MEINPNKIERRSRDSVHVDEYSVHDGASSGFSPDTVLLSLDWNVTSRMLESRIKQQLRGTAIPGGCLPTSSRCILNFLCDEFRSQMARPAKSSLVNERTIQVLTGQAWCIGPMIEYLPEEVLKPQRLLWTNNVKVSSNGYYPPCFVINYHYRL